MSLGLLLFACLLLGACQTDTGLAPVTNGWQMARRIQGAYEVQPGDTLYSIAWRFGHDYRKLARLNHLQSPYTLAVGDRIYLVSKTARAKVNTSQTLAPQPIKTPQITQPRQTKSNPSYRPVPQKTNVRKHHQRSSRPLPAFSGRRVSRWRWPASGRVIKLYGKLNKGIDIAGQFNEPVRAAAAGQVVYSGSGLRGYGKLLIIKHNAEYLSAYAHNHKLLVAEGMTVKRGQVIAKMGKSGAKKVMLHFEIRRSGKPINPLRLLPKRR